ncbi:PREDICTED: uncharacterized protein C22orf15 homolog [Chaetura pelagica]|uniref:uncharacterized protein C22orf15 homolog n=1 Tax=Chaetura pelagica TaxID=8897 RepID=UPI000523E34F|nr:PREDICTED: uncharacterized protein C22orf15 homolog [Chaetura pelagica]
MAKVSLVTQPPSPAAPPPCDQDKFVEGDQQRPDNRQELVNLQCRVLILMAHLKMKCQCRPADCIKILDERGALVNLSKVENPASEFSSKYLRERESYILLRVLQGESPEATCYESLLDNLGKHYPDLAGRLQQLSANTPTRDQQRTGPLQRRAQPLTGTPARPTSQSKKSSELKNTSK